MSTHNLTTLYLQIQNLVLDIFKEWAKVNDDTDFIISCQKVDPETLQLFDDEKYTPTLMKPLQFDLRKGRGSKWNNFLFLLLSHECFAVARSLNPNLDEDDCRVRQHQYEAMLRDRYNTAWKGYRLVQFRNGEMEDQRRERVAQALQKNEVVKRKSASRVQKYKNRLKAIKERKNRGSSVHAMNVAKEIVETLGKDGMSSEEEITNDVTGMVAGYKVSTLEWRSEGIGCMLHKVDEIYLSVKSPKGAKRLERFRGEISSRPAVRNLTYQYYARDWLDRTINRGYDILKGGSDITGWTNYHTWEASLQPAFRSGN